MELQGAPHIHAEYVHLMKGTKMDQGCRQMMEQECRKTEGQRTVLNSEDRQLSGPEEKSSGRIGRRLLTSPLSDRGVGTCQPAAL